MKCKYCGSEMLEGAIYCEHCGKPVQMVPDYNVFDDEVLPSLVSDEEKKKKNNENAASSAAENRTGRRLLRQRASKSGPWSFPASL